MDSGSVEGGGVGDFGGVGGCFVSGGGCGAGVSIFGSSVSDSGMRTSSYVLQSGYKILYGRERQKHTLYEG